MSWQVPITSVLLCFSIFAVDTGYAKLARKLTLRSLFKFVLFSFFHDTFIFI